ncbi:Hypothetical predicted protein [Octopus vulgaris]|uniref:Uncharacterized protein n=1 Tax=Octopus vulgaris TaxID=6645 RepID=A0AA36EZF1_OCTVU|nr:Hypothetical predicted protein [Octopus vulgaris]
MKDKKYNGEDTEMEEEEEEEEEHPIMHMIVEQCNYKHKLDKNLLPLGMNSKNTIVKRCDLCGLIKEEKDEACQKLHTGEFMLTCDIKSA